MSDESNIQTRRGTRLKKPSLIALEIENNSRRSRNLSTPSESEQSNRSDDDNKMDIEKPIALFEGDDIEGKKMYSFQTPKKRASLLQKVTDNITPNRTHGKSSTTDVVKTPYRSKLRKELVARVKAAESSTDEDFSDSGSEYKPTDSSSSHNEDTRTSEEKSSEEDVEERTTYKNRKTVKCQSPSKSRTKKDLNYFMKTDDYFAQNATKTIVTSNHTLDKLQTPRLPQEQLQTLLSGLKLSRAHQDSLNVLAENTGSCFNKWLLLLNEGFNVLLYGLGSKRNLLQRFCADTVPTSPTVVVNGFFPSLSVKDILDGIIQDFLELSEHPVSPFEACALIEDQFKRHDDLHLYLIVHNIDGPMLRNNKNQSVIAQLASIKNIHLVASVDHINAPLLWDHSKISKFNFSWWDVTSFLPYTNETSYESSMMVKRSGNLALSSLGNVFLSLTTNSKGIYLVIVKKQLENKGVQHYQGLLFKDLYWACREAFLVSSDLALRAQLTEFVDHKMVKFRRSVDGGEYLFIPIDNNLLQKFVDTQNK